MLYYDGSNRIKGFFVVMSLDFAGLDHNCNVIRRQMEEEFRNLAAVFIVHKTGEREKTIVDKRNLILSKPYGRKLYDILLSTKDVQLDSSKYLGIIVNQHKLFNLYLKKHHTAVFFINADRFYTDYNAQHYIYNLVWHALSDLDRITTEMAKTNFPQTRLIKPEHDALEQSKRNLSADIFGALMMEIQGHHDYILQLAKRRSIEPLTDIPENVPETFPYPISYEACKLVYDDLKGTIDRKSRLMKQMMELASEVALTYGDTSIKEWWSFCRPTQEMAWQGHTEDKNLGYAIYTSENTFVRAFAYQIAELIDADPDPNIDSRIYNAFAPDEHNERIHKTKCGETIQSIVALAALQGSPNILRQEAGKEDAALIAGTLPCGWCGYALRRTADLFETRLRNEDHVPAEQLLEACYGELGALSWAQIKSLGNVIYQIRRRNTDPTGALIAVMLEKANAPETLSAYFRDLDIQG